MPLQPVVGTEVLLEDSENCHCCYTSQHIDNSYSWKWGAHSVRAKTLYMGGPEQGQHKQHTPSGKILYLDALRLFLVAYEIPLINHYIRITYIAHLPDLDSVTTQSTLSALVIN